MGLITKEVTTKWSPTNKNWYESKGYKFTKMCDKLTVNVENLPSGSSEKVEIQCDHCGKILKREYKRYLKRVKFNNTYYCRLCTQKLFVGEKTRKTKLKNGTSFEQWCIDNNRQDILNRWDYELNECKPEDICYSAVKKYYFICPQKIHKSELKNIHNFVQGQDKSICCLACNGFAQWGIDNICPDFLDKYWDYEKNKIDPWIIQQCAGKKVWIKCQENPEHKSYKIYCNHFHHGGRCPECNNSTGEKRIREYLIQNNINFISQKVFVGLVGLGNGNLSYDFYLPDYNLLIEYQGEFHDGHNSKGNYYMKQNLKRQQEHDKRKREYAKVNNINLLEIWYWDFDKIEEILNKM
jgi:hypothetical protein